MTAPVQESLETVDCLICRSKNFKPLFTKKDKFHISVIDFTVGECESCHFVYLNPRPSIEEIGKFYPEMYQWRERGEKISGLGSLAARAEKFYRQHQIKTEIKRLKQNIPNVCGRLLDIGCGTGDRLELLAKEGFEVKGVETSEQADYAAKHFNLDVFKGTLKQAAYPDHYFDRVTMYNVLEHVHDARDLLLEVKRILKPGGALVVEVPNQDSWQARILRRRWAAVDIPRDLYYFNFGSLSKLLSDLGIQITRKSYMTDFFHPPTLVISLFPSLDPQMIWSSEARDRKGGILKRILWAGLTLLFAPLAYAENLFGRGALVTVFAVKKKEMSA